MHDEFSNMKRLDFIKAVTGFDYFFAEANSRQWQKGDIQKGTFYQLTPSSTDDGFFNWYSRKYKDEQFFRTEDTCTLCFLYNYKWWVEEGRPSE